MMTIAALGELMGSLLAYPREDYRERLEACIRALQEDYTRPGQLLESFRDRIRALPLEDLEELYTQTFDINPVCCLEVGWQLFGEEYARGAFLVDMRRMLQECAIPESKELPDHMSHALALLDRLGPQPARTLAVEAVLPALKKMLAALAGKENPFEIVLTTIESVLHERFAAR